MHRLTYYPRWGCLAACLVFFTGCSGSPTLDTEPVEGVVTLDGTPVSGATVMFVAVNEGQGMSANGYTDENGIYRLTAVDTKGAVAEAEGGTLPGEYYVGVVKSETEAQMSAEEAYKQGVKLESSSGSSAPKAPEVTHIVPQKYNNPRQSGLKVTVQEGKNNIPIELSSK
jgi:hypothetical protein